MRWIVSRYRTLTRKIIASAWTAALCAMLVVGCTERTPAIQMESPTVALSPAFVGVAAVFMKISNSGGEDELVSARTDIPGTVVELHDIQGGKMVKVERISVAADSSVVLRPARQHLMIFKLPQDVAAGFRFTLVLTFKKSGEKTVPVELTKFTGASPLLQK